MDMMESNERWLEEIESETNSASKLFAAITTNILLFFLIFGLSATVEMKSLKYQLKNKWAIFTGVAMQFIIMPMLGFLSVLMLRNSEYTEAMTITLLVITSSPGGSFSNWWCSLFNADLALSVAMTSVSSILSIALLPGNLVLYSYLAFVAIPGKGKQEVEILQALDFKAIFTSLGVVMGGILLGLYAGNVNNNSGFHKRANNFGSFCGLLLVLFSTFLGSGGGGADTNFWSLPWSFYVGTAFPCVVGLVLARNGCGLY
jgi:predicted Na+-dependent transporter